MNVRNRQNGNNIHTFFSRKYWFYCIFQKGVDLLLVVINGLILEASGIMVGT